MLDAFTTTVCNAQHMDMIDDVARASDVAAVTVPGSNTVTRPSLLSCCQTYLLFSADTMVTSCKTGFNPLPSIGSDRRPSRYTVENDVGRPFGESWVIQSVTTLGCSIHGREIEL